MAARVLNEEQRLAVVEWLAAGHTNPLIQMLFTARGWVPIANQSLDHYRESRREEIDRRRAERQAAAFDRGFAQWQVRVKALVEHAETLQAIAWVPDDKGKLHNEKAFREVLDDIAKEMGGRRQGIDISKSISNLTDAELEEYIAAAERRIAQDRQRDQGGSADAGNGDAAGSGDQSLPLSE
jgi:hypothetical protein